jgi:hypothetical protein
MRRVFKKKKKTSKNQKLYNKKNKKINFYLIKIKSNINKNHKSKKI